MRVKIETAAIWEGTRYKKGSVIEVPAETYELNKSWMKATDEEPKNDDAEEKVPGES